jgi:hypothetical protein
MAATTTPVEGAVFTGPGAVFAERGPVGGDVHGGVHGGQVRSAERALSAGTWLIVCGAVLYSVLTVTPLMESHTPEGWEWTAPILPVVVDAAVVIVVRLDSVLARLGARVGGWPVVLRWMTGAMTLSLNTASSLLARDPVGAAVHAVAPLLLIVTAETGLAYRRAIADALAERERAERERAEAEAQRAREEREHRARLLREQREHEAAVERERAERAEAARRAEQAERERVEREREQQRLAAERAERAREQQRRDAERERAERAAREQAERERERAALLAAGPAREKLPEDRARVIVTAAYEAGCSVRAAAELCGWSIGWVSARFQDLRDGESADGARLRAVGA